MAGGGDLPLSGGAPVGARHARSGSDTTFDRAPSAAALAEADSRGGEGSSSGGIAAGDESSAGVLRAVARRASARMVRTVCRWLFAPA